ncbi:hypothetical protein STTU_1902 [Streptomyces sp. Tu6071]|nr:hypothetical protein STTU_1902 [Streptomyces sp. Tu6071]
MCRRGAEPLVGTGLVLRVWGRLSLDEPRGPAGQGSDGRVRDAAVGTGQ